MVSAAWRRICFYDKTSSSAEVKQHMVKLCAGDAACEGAVNTHFAGCFEQAYKMGGRRQSSRLEVSSLVECINTQAGKAYFSYNGK